MSNNTNTQEIEQKLQNLLNEVKKVNTDIAETRKLTDESFNAIESEVATVIKDIDAACDELQQIEQLASDDIDQLILGQAEEVAQAE